MHEHQHQAASVDHHDVSDVAFVSDEVWEQKSPVGGESFTGQPAYQAVPVTVAGIVQVRDQPTLAGSAGAIPTSTTAAKRLLGRAPQRRHVRVSCDTDCWIGVDGSLVENRSAFLLTAGSILQLTYADELWVMAKTTAGNATFFAELDQG